MKTSVIRSFLALTILVACGEQHVQMGKVRVSIKGTAASPTEMEGRPGPALLTANGSVAIEEYRTTLTIAPSLPPGTYFLAASATDRAGHTGEAFKLAAIAGSGVLNTNNFTI